MNTGATDSTRGAPPGVLPEHVSPLVQEALREGKARLQETYGERLRRVILYGSQARGEAFKDSDIDVLVEGPIGNIYDEVKRVVVDVEVDLFERYRLGFSFKPYTEAEYQDLRRPFLQNIHAEGVELRARPQPGPERAAGEAPC